MRSRLIASSTILALAAAGTFALAPADASTATGRTSAKPTPTHFALQASGFGTRARGGQVPAGSDSTAFQQIGCTNRAGLDRENHGAQETIPGLGTASEVKTRVWTTSKRGTVSSWSRNTIAKLTLADNPIGTLDIEGIRSLSRAFHDDKGFHAVSSAAIARITFTPTGGQPLAEDIPTPGQPLDIPGLATITVGASKKRVTSGGALATTDVIRIYSAATGTRARVASSHAVIQGGIQSGIFSGFGSGSRAQAADGHVTSGRTPYLVMPCQGTGGKVHSRTIASVTPDSNLILQGLTANEKSQQTRRSASGYVTGEVAHLALGGDQLVVDGILGRVNVTRKGHKVTKSIKGTTIGSITSSGQPQTFPDTGVLEIPGVAKLERSVVTKTKTGIHVIALRITLLDGSLAVINLGEARLKIKSSGN